MDLPKLTEFTHEELQKQLDEGIISVDFLIDYIVERDKVYNMLVKVANEKLPSEWVVYTIQRKTNEGQWVDFINDRYFSLEEAKEIWQRVHKLEPSVMWRCVEVLYNDVEGSSC